MFRTIRTLSAQLFPTTATPTTKSTQLGLDTLGERLAPAVVVPKPTASTTVMTQSPASVVTPPQLDLRFGQHAVSKLSQVADDGECGNNSPKMDPMDPRNKVDPMPTGGGDGDPRVILLGVAVR